MPDAFDRLWTPHRMVYIKGENKPASGEADECPFCTIVAGDGRRRPDRAPQRRSPTWCSTSIPYSPGHLLVCPYRHVADYPDLTEAETTEIGLLTQQAMTVLRRASAPHGFNLGINQGAVAGAGIAAHLHQHVVPRWSR